MQKKIQAAQRRMVLLRMGQFALRGAFYALCAGVLLVLALKLYPMDLAPLWWTALAVAGASVAAGLGALLRVPTLTDAAIECDRRSGLAERLSTALALAPQAQHDPVVQAVQRDAAAHAERVRVGQIFRFEWPWQARYLAAPLAALLVCHLLLPECDLWDRREAIQKRKEHLALMQRQAAKVTEIKDKVLKDLDHDQDWDGLEAAFDQTAREIEKPKITRPKAMAKLSRLEQTLEERRRRLTGKAPGKLPRSLERKLEVTKSAAEAMNDGKIGQAAEELKAIAEQLSQGTLSAEAKAKLKQELKALAGELAKQNPDLAKQLAKAAERLTDQDVARAAEALRKAGTDLKELQQMLQQIDGMDKALEQVAKLKQQLRQKPGPHHKCRSCAAPLQCDHPLCDAAAGGECPLGKACPHNSGLCPACKAMGADYRQLAQAGQQAQAGQPGQPGQIGQMGQRQQQGQGQQGQGQQGQGQQGQGQQGQGQQGQGQQGQGQQGQGQQGQGQQGQGQQGQGQQGQGQGQGPGMGGPGQGRGGWMAGIEDPSVKFQATKIKGERTKAKPLGVFFTRGAGKKGKSTVKAMPVIQEFRQAAEDALTRERIPAGYKSYIRRYFSTLEPEKKVAP